MDTATKSKLYKAADAILLEAYAACKPVEEERTPFHDERRKEQRRNAAKILSAKLNTLREEYNKKSFVDPCDQLKFDITAHWIARYSLLELDFMSALTPEKADQLYKYQAYLYHGL